MKTMSCNDVLERLDDFIDDELTTTTATALSAHLDACPDCRCQAESLRALVEQARALPGVAPSRELWPEIAVAIAEQPVRRRFARPWSVKRRLVRPNWWQALGAAAGLVLASTLLLGYLMGPADAPPTGAKRSEIALAARAAVAAFAESEADFIAARAELLTALEKRRGAISPHTMAVVMDSMRIIEGSISGINAALKEDPGSTRLVQLLASAYQREIELLQQATSLPTQT